MEGTSVTVSQFEELLKQTPVPVSEAFACIIEASKDPATAKLAATWSKNLEDVLVKNGDFDSVYSFFRDRFLAGLASLSPLATGQILRDCCKDRSLRAMLEVANFGGTEVAGRPVPASVKGALPVPMEESFRRFEVLRPLVAGDQIIDKAWGFGVIKRVDSFYKRIIVDFNNRPNHAISFATACASLTRAPRLHFWTILHNEPQNVVKLVEEEPGKLVQLLLRSFGPMPVTRLQERLQDAKLVGPAEWKNFWEKARRELKNDARVKIPVRRTDSIQISAEAETYEDGYFKRLAAIRDSNQIIACVAELESHGKIKGMSEDQRAILHDRLCFALKGAENVNLPLYARIAVVLQRLGYSEPPAEDLRAALWNENEYLRAAYKLSAREVEGMVALLLGEGESAEAKLIDALSYNNEEATDDEPPHWAPSCATIANILDSLKERAACEDACFELMNKPKAPPAVVGWIFRNRKSLVWKKQIPFIRLIDHALALIEMSASGEALQVQNSLKSALDSNAWWVDATAELTATERRLLFERIQSSAQMESAFQRKLMAHMLDYDPELKKYRRAAIQREKNSIRLTSLHSMAERQLTFKKLVEIEIPKNRKAIQEAKEKGDLSENAEYQYAKDKERELLQRQAELSAEIKKVTETDFANMPTDRVGQGVTVRLGVANGTELVYTILGEWDYDEELHIISNKTRLAKSIEGTKAGDKVRIPSQDGEQDAQILEILPLSDEIRTWINALPQE